VLALREAAEQVAARGVGEVVEDGGDLARSFQPRGRTLSAAA
jgi:hypothetical protein